MSNRVLIVSAEASSALYARRLLEEWKRRNVAVSSFGVGDGVMEKLGFSVLGRSEDMAVVGFREVLRHYPQIRRVFKDILAECDREKPKFALLLDYPDFNFRLAKELKKRDIPVIYYISPQLWAWRTGRLNLVKKYIDKMLVLFPFEKEFYAKHGVDVDFVGHPLLDELSSPDLSEDKIKEARSRLGLDDHDLLVGLLPGSRRSEIESHLALLLKSAEKIHELHPSVRFALLVAPGVDDQWLRSQLPPYDLPLIFLQDEPLKMAHMLNMAVSASGTATLVLGLANCPMVVIYRMKSLSAWLARRFVKGVSYFAMINLIFGKRLVPEFFQNEANVENISEVIHQWISNPQSYEEVKVELATLKNRLGAEGTTARVADSLQEFFR